MSTTATCAAGCGQPIDLRQPHDALVRQREHEDQWGNTHVDDLPSVVGRWHVECGDLVAPRLDVQPDPVGAIERGDYTPGCSNEACICHDPAKWRLCSEWMGASEESDRTCARCGWARELHQDAHDHAEVV